MARLIPSLARPQKRSAVSQSRSRIGQESGPRAHEESIRFERGERRASVQTSKHPNP